MSPTPGSIHRRPRKDSGAARLWQWARSRRAPWTCPAAAEACDVSSRRARMIVAALHDAGLLACVQESETTVDGAAPAQWEMSAAGRAATGAPIMIVDGETGLIVGVRMPSDGDGNEALRRSIERAELSTREAARRLGVNDSTLRRMIRGATIIGRDDPIIGRARGLAK